MEKGPVPSVVSSHTPQSAPPYTSDSSFWVDYPFKIFRPLVASSSTNKQAFDDDMQQSN